jgi:hypothetical protein
LLLIPATVTTVTTVSAAADAAYSGSTTIATTIVPWACHTSDIGVSNLQGYLGSNTSFRFSNATFFSLLLLLLKSYGKIINAVIHIHCFSEICLYNSKYLQNSKTQETKNI